EFRDSARLQFRGGAILKSFQSSSDETCFEYSLFSREGHHTVFAFSSPSRLRFSAQERGLSRFLGRGARPLPLLAKPLSSLAHPDVPGDRPGFLIGHWRPASLRASLI